MEKSIKNIFAKIPEAIPEEIFQNIVRTGDVKIERIVSAGQATPEGEWYDQDQNEWVMVVRGSAGLIFEDSDEIVTLNEGDYVNIPAHVKHRVAWTDPHEKTVWLAVHYR
jgi:cupin 2 domain-containing protein